MTNEQPARLGLPVSAKAKEGHPILKSSNLQIIKSSKPHPFALWRNTRYYNYGIQIRDCILKHAATKL